MSIRKVAKKTVAKKIAKKTVAKKTVAKKIVKKVSRISKVKKRGTAAIMIEETRAATRTINPKKSAIEFIKGGVTAPKGFAASGIRAGIKSKLRALDLGVVISDRPADAAGVFTTNVMCAACVDRVKTIVPSKHIRAIVCNSGCANSCTGAGGARDDVTFAKTVANVLDTHATSVITASTGVIGKFLPMEKIAQAVPKLVESAEASASGGKNFAKAIITTDLVTKEAAVRVTSGRNSFTIGGVAKGSGMIHPNMATMLCFITTDAAVDRTLLDTALKRVTASTFNCLTVDGDSSTNDMVIVMANGASGVGLGKVVGDFKVFEDALYEVCNDLCRQIAADGEGATKHIEVRVRNAKTTADAQLAARSVASSNLVKCAIFGNDPNWGRIACAVGNSGAEISRRRMTIDLCGVRVFENTQPAKFNEERTRAKLIKAKSVVIDVDLGIGGIKNAVAHTCDFSYDYVKINAEYRT